MPDKRDADTFAIAQLLILGTMSGPLLVVL